MLRNHLVHKHSGRMATVHARVPHYRALHRCDVGEQCTGINQEIQKIFVIPKPNASDNPRAMVIHAQEACVAHAAVVRARRFFFVALAAPQGATSEAKKQSQHKRGRCSEAWLGSSYLRGACTVEAAASSTFENWRSTAVWDDNDERCCSCALSEGEGDPAGVRMQRQ